MIQDHNFAIPNPTIPNQDILGQFLGHFHPFLGQKYQKVNGYDLNTHTPLTNRLSWAEKYWSHPLGNSKNIILVQKTCAWYLTWWVLSSDQFPPAVSDLSLWSAIKTWLPFIKHLWNFSKMMVLENSELSIHLPIVHVLVICCCFYSRCWCVLVRLWGDSFVAWEQVILVKHSFSRTIIMLHGQNCIFPYYKKLES